MRSIRSELLRSLWVRQVLLLVALEAIVAYFGTRSLTQTFDARLDEKVRTLATLVRQEGPLIELEFSEELMPGYSREDDPEYFQVWIVDAGVLERSDTLGDAQLDEPAVELGVVRHGDVRLPDGRDGRQAWFSIPVHEYEPEDELGRTASQRTTSVVVAISREELDGQLLLLLAALGGVGLAVGALGALSIRRVLDRGLEPIGALSSEVESIDDPADRGSLAALEPTRELEPIKDGVDRMLERLGEAFERERRLSGSIAHELRTPIAELRTAMDVALLDGEDVEGLRDAANEAREIACEMDTTIAALLRVWRHELDVDRALGGVRLRDAVSRALDSAESVAEPRGMRFEGELPDESLLVAVAERPVALVVGNLFGNAASHGTPESTARWGVSRDGDDVELVIENDHDPEAVSHDDGHAGLGIALSRALCAATGMELSIEVSPLRYVARLTAPAVT